MKYYDSLGSNSKDGMSSGDINRGFSSVDGDELPEVDDYGYNKIDRYDLMFSENKEETKIKDGGFLGRQKGWAR